MSKILPTYGPDFINYRYPDNITSPTISNNDYFYTANNKNFIYKNETGVVTYVNIDFWSLDNLYFNNRIFTTV
jgi:hypothetical protein